MKARVTLRGHPVHPMLVVLPLGLLTTSVVFDSIGLVLEAPEWHYRAHWMLASGVVTATLAAPFGAADWLSLPKRSRARRAGVFHGLSALVTFACFALAWYLRAPLPEAPGAAALALSYGGFVMLMLTGWLGGELVYHHAAGVTPEPVNEEEVAAERLRMHGQ